MLYPHSLLWHYLWVGPHVLQLCLAFIIWRRGLYKQSPLFLLYLVYEGLESLTLYGLDISPSLISDLTWWRADYAAWLLEGPLKVAVIWEVFRHLARPRFSAKRYTRMFFGGTALLGCIALWAASQAPQLYPKFPIVSHVHALIEGMYIASCGLWLFTFLYAAYFHLHWDRSDFGIALGAGISSCVHLAAYAIFANYRWFPRQFLLDFLSMTTYHVCVVIWCCYLLRPRGQNAAASGLLRASQSEVDPPSDQPLDLQSYRLFA